MATERIQRRIERLLDQVEEAADQEGWDVVRRLSRQVLELHRTTLRRRPSWTSLTAEGLSLEPPLAAVMFRGIPQGPMSKESL